MKLKSSILLACLLGTLLLASAFAQKIKGNEEIITITRPISAFDEVEVSGGLSVDYSKGNSETLKLKGESNLLKHVKTDVKNGRLVIKLNKNVTSKHGIKIYLTGKELKSIDLSGAVIFKSKDRLSSSQLKIDLSSASILKSEIACNELKAELSGASKLILSGTATTATIKGSGASMVNSPDLKIETAHLELSGASVADIEVRKSLDATASGASVIKYKGKPVISKNLSGAATLRQM